MERTDVIRRMVLDEICDDYENVDQVILRNVAKDCAKLGIAIERSDIVNALASLIEDGLAKAYLLSCMASAKEFDGMPPIDAVQENFETYFYITDKGMDLHQSDGLWWPFDEEGEPRI
ncbi:MAG: hypothetical protein ACRD4P_09325 [Bryobacteraceae bacterium]